VDEVLLLLVTGMGSANSELVQLRRWRVDEPESRGRVGVEPIACEPDHVGGAVEALVVELNPSGARASRSVDP
jgi:hypothetical protein